MALGEAARLQQHQLLEALEEIVLVADALPASRPTPGRGRGRTAGSWREPNTGRGGFPRAVICVICAAGLANRSARDGSAARMEGTRGGAAAPGGLRLRP